MKNLSCLFRYDLMFLIRYIFYHFVVRFKSECVCAVNTVFSFLFQYTPQLVYSRPLIHVYTVYFWRNTVL